LDSQRQSARGINAILNQRAWRRPPFWTQEDHYFEPHNQNQNLKENRMGIIWWIIVGVIAGWATGKIMKGSGYGFWADMLLGIAGALVGGYLAGFLGFSHAGGMIYTILIAIVGAIVLVFLFRLITGRR
jgi:uncharacterized membrane protein YeaQ/YmgE (transglycosylase-associated protein family)